MIKTEEIVNLTIPSGQNYGKKPFTPPQGMIIACAIFTNDAANTGFQTAKISYDTGDIVSDTQDIRNYRDREAGYIEGKKPLMLDTCGRSFVLEVFATANYAADFQCQLVLVYHNPNIPQQF